MFTSLHRPVALRLGHFLLRPAALALLLSALAAALLLPALARAQEPASVAQLLPRIDSLFSEWESTHTPGCALGVVQEGELVLSRGYGMGNLDHGIPLSGESVFYLASVSKQFTAAAVTLASLEGHFSLEDPVRLHFPELPDYGSVIRVGHLLHHTSGLRDYLTLMSLARMPLENVYTDGEILELIFRQEELNFAPGEEFLYSNTNYVLLAELIHRTTGMTLAEYARDRIFGPLGMTSTHFHDDATVIVPGRVFSYAWTPTGGYRTDYLMNFDKVGDGGLYSSVEDLYRWDQNFYHKRVGGEALHALLHTRGVLNSGDTIAYALGLGLGEHRGLATVSHGGGLMNFRTNILRFPEEAFTVIALCNTGRANPSRISTQVAELFLGDRMEPEEERGPGEALRPAPEQRPTPPTPTEAQLRAYAGSFYSPELDVTYELTVVDGVLAAATGPGGSVILRPAQENSFRLQGATLRFQRDVDGVVQGFRLDAGRVRNLRFQRVR